MEAILSQTELWNLLHKFRNTLINYDYSDINNITFINLESLYSYIYEHENNPFERQYSELQTILDRIEPYLPFAIGDTAVEFLNRAAQITSHEDMKTLKNEFASKTRMDFINVVQSISSEDEWLYLINLCENIRRNKEEVYH